MQNSLSSIFEQAAKQLEIKSIDDLLTPAFIKKHSKYDTVTDWLSAGGYTVESDTAEIEDYVMQTTDFDTWESMLESAVMELINQSFFGFN